MNTKLGGALISVIGVAVICGTTGAVYACPQPAPQPPHPPNCLDLKIKDQDQGWGDGVDTTWKAGNMVPGSTYNFDGSFLGLKTNTQGRLGITCGYSVTEESPPVESDTDPHTNLNPGKMAKQLIITRCLYQYGGWQIDLLTGLPTGLSTKDRRDFYNCYGLRWQITDADHDGRITFNDLKEVPLAGLPLLNSNSTGARFVMSVKFAETAGNDLQGDRFNLTMSYTLKPW
jgi:hypothetical protein